MTYGWLRKMEIVNLMKKSFDTIVKALYPVISFIPKRHLEITGKY